MNIIKNPIDFDSISFRKYPNRKLTKNIHKQIYGLDTETLDGYVKLIADSDARFSLNPESHLDILEFLTHEKYRSNIQFFYNINYDMNSIIKSFPVDNIRELGETGKTKIGDYGIFIIPKKLLRIHKNKSTYAFYDLFQYYETSLERAALKFLGLNKYSNPVDTNILGSCPDYWNRYEKMIIDYCISDSLLCKKLGDILQNTLFDAINLYPDSYISKAGLTKQYIRKCCDVPDIRNVPRSALKFAFNSYSGGRFEILKKGYVGDCTLFDIVSAYPYYIKHLIDITNGDWRYVDNMHENAYYGFYIAEISTKYNRIMPLPYVLPNGIICYPNFESGVFISKQELLSLEPYIDFDIISGWEFYPNEIVYPFAEYIDTIFTKKSQTPKADYKYNLYKILMNSLYGCFYEKIPSKRDSGLLAGKLFNPVYATMITAMTRLQLFELSMAYPNEVIGFATDSILFAGKPDIPSIDSLGKWSFEISGDTTVLRSGIYKIDDKLKSRGIKKNSRIITPTECSYNDIFDYIKSEPTKTVYPIIINRPLSFIECLHHHKIHDLTDINRFTDMEYNIDINTDYKRIWDDTFSSGSEIFTRSIDSKPLLIE